MSTKTFGRLLAAVVICLALAACASTDATAEGFKTVTIRGGDQGALIIDVRDNKGSLSIRQGSYTIASVLVSKKRWQRLVDSWREVQLAADEGRPSPVGVLKMGENQRLDFETGKNVKITFIDDTQSRTFAIYPEDYEIFTDALERVLARLPD